MYMKCEDVVNLVENVRTMYWTDWEEMCSQVHTVHTVHLLGVGDKGKVVSIRRVRFPLVDGAGQVIDRYEGMGDRVGVD